MEKTKPLQHFRQDVKPGDIVRLLYSEGSFVCHLDGYIDYDNGIHYAVFKEFYHPENDLDFIRRSSTHYFDLDKGKFTNGPKERVKHYEILKRISI